MLVALVVLQVATLAVPVDAGPSGYAACMVTCFEMGASVTAASLGLALPAGVFGAAACAALCAAAGSPLLVCFDPSTVLLGPCGSLQDRRCATNITSVVPGSLVVTMTPEGAPSLTKVTANIRHVGSFDYVQLDTGAGALRVTPNHGIVVFNGSAAFVVTAATVAVGDVVQVSPTARVPVRSIEWTRRDGKYELETESGTVLASGMLATTICDADLEHGVRYPLEEKLGSWKEKHSLAHWRQKLGGGGGGPAAAATAKRDIQGALGAHQKELNV